MKSMTGYAALDTMVLGKSLHFEIKSYNNRYLNLKVILPNWLSGIEPFVREFFVGRLVRGDVEVVLRCMPGNEAREFRVNEDLVRSYQKGLEKIATLTKLSWTEQGLLEYIASQPEVLFFEERVENLEEWKQALLPVLELGFTAFEKGRSDEGERCKANIKQQLACITEAIDSIEKFSAQSEDVFRELVKTKCQEFMSTTLNDERILQEVALMLVKYTINEEIVRLRSHLECISSEIDSHKASAKRFDFICQEINREINTISSKSISYDVSKEVIVVKEAVENIREQLKNLE